MFASLRSRKHIDPRVVARRSLFNPAAEANYLGGNLARLLVDGYALWLK